MRTSQALFIISSLAEGFDPSTGEIIPTDSYLQRDDVAEALARASRALEAAKRNEERRACRPSKAGAPWSPQEDSDLVDGFECGVSIKELAIKHKRTQWAIRSRLVKHGQIEEGALP